MKEQQKITFVCTVPSIYALLILVSLVVLVPLILRMELRNAEYNKMREAQVQEYKDLIYKLINDRKKTGCPQCPQANETINPCQHEVAPSGNIDTYAKVKHSIQK